MSRKILKWIGIVLVGLLGLLLLAAAGLYFVGTAKFNKKYDIPVETVTVPTDPGAIDYGQHLATIFLCANCHTDNLGGKLFYDLPGMLSIPTPNLTSGAGGVGVFYSDEDWVRAIRHGVGYDGRALFIMESRAFYNISDEDLGALIAYIKSVPPVDNQFPVRSAEPLGRLMMGVGMVPPFPADQIDHTGPRPSAPAPGVTAEYGRYLTHTCTECHGTNLNGAPFGPPGQEVLTPNLTPGGELGTWTETDFFTTLRTGMTPHGQPLSDEMPWKYYGQMTDEELRAIWTFLRSLPALEQGKQ
jgi:mono/diheme cytochrome c family protein